MKSFIDVKKIDSLLQTAQAATKKEALAVIQKALQLKGLTPSEVAILLSCSDREVVAQLWRAARQVKENIYGQRLVLFAPLYITNYCVNNCLYCGFRSGNRQLDRRRLSLDEIKSETALLEEEGHKRILLVGGEDPACANISFLEKAIAAVYSIKVEHGCIRRLNVNVAPMSVSNFKRLKKTGIGTYQLFQETYHPATYKKMHPTGPKANYQYRLYAMHRAQTAGISDVGIGVLFGLHDYKFEVLALLFHALELEKNFGAGPHTISVPRIEPAHHTPLAGHPPAPVSDFDFKKVVAILRLAVPYTGLILSTRETKTMRNELFGLGISQISAGSQTNPGGYKTKNKRSAAQFFLSDDRSLLEVIKDISRMGYLPSFCTACYRLGRVGKDFMELAKPGLIQQFCQPNSLLTYKEYLEDYGDKEANAIGKKVLSRELKKINNVKLKTSMQNKLKRIAGGERDLYC